MTTPAPPPRPAPVVAVYPSFSRVLLVIPPKDGYGSAGSSAAGINGTDTLVFVVDIVDAAA